MLGLPLQSRRLPIALDIGTHSIKMLQMRKVGSGLGACACGRWCFPASAGQDPEERKKLIVEAVRDMLRNGNFRGRRVISALSCDQLAIKNIRLPHMSESELLRAVEWEVKDRFAFEVGPDQLNYFNAGQVRQGAEIRDEIIVLAASRETVAEHLALLAEIGLRAEHIDAEPAALFRGFDRFLRRQADEEAVSVIVDIGLSGSRVVVARGRQIAFIKNIDIGGRRFTRAVAKQLNLEYEEAGELRVRLAGKQGSSFAEPGGRGVEKHGGSDPNSVNWTVYDALRGEVEELAKEIGLCLRYCSVTFRGLRPRQVTLTGGEAGDPALLALLSEHVGTPFVVGDPLKSIDLSRVYLGGDRRGMLAEWAVCAGLALKGVTFEKAEGEVDDGNHRLSA